MTDNFDVERPPLRIDLEGNQEVKMTYGLEMDLRRMLPNAQSALQLVMHDSYTQDYIVRRCLTDITKPIKSEEDLVPVEQVNLSSDDTERLLMWAVEHVLYFFVKRAKSMTQLGARYQNLLPKKEEESSTPSENGSENSASPTPSAGPTE